MAGYRNKKMIAPLYFKGTTVKEVVDYWCEKILKEEINKGDVVVMDNATFLTLPFSMYREIKTLSGS
jgi:hypothetical protein